MKLGQLIEALQSQCHTEADKDAQVYVFAAGVRTIETVTEWWHWCRGRSEAPLETSFVSPGKAGPTGCFIVFSLGEPVQAPGKRQDS
jgi:hypothetical protein